MVLQTPRINTSLESIFAFYDNEFSKSQHDQKKKNINNTMSIIIEFIANTNYEIQTWTIKTCCKLHTHKIREYKILKAQKIRKLKMLKPKKTN